MENSGAKAALRGYRLQTLYILHEILKSNDRELIFQPEGNEDLAVYQGDRLVRAIQVKALSVPLTLSHFINAEKKDTFIKRSLDLMKVDNTTRIEVVSFGIIGDELLSAWSKSDSKKEANQKKIRNKLVNFKVSDSEVDQLFDCLVWHSVLEDGLCEEVSKYLRQTLTSGSIEHALSLLTSWLYVASEKRTKITHDALIEKVTSIGQYFAQREAHHLEWFKSITPLEFTKQPENSRLEAEFYRGVSTRFSHIQANLDIIRNSQLTEIDSKFKKSQTVIVHGASGQGKTTLAYRYLHEYVPESWRLQVNFIEDRIHAQTIALAIADQLAIFDANLYLYIDVTPRDPDWTALVKALLERPNIKILVSIREEDLARQNISNDQLGFPALVQLNLSQEEAKYIYLNLVDKGVAKPYPSFEQAWLGFGGKGSLLEYVFFLTQTESLKERLNAQVSRLRAEVREGRLEACAIKLLFAAALATSYEARVNIKSLVKTAGLNDPQGTFNLFEDEYLIRLTSDKTYIEALHPIRSKLLTEVLDDPAFSPWIDSALFVMPSIPEADLETFLLYSFVDNPNEFQKLFDGVRSINIKAWGTIAGIGRAILWFGIRSHVIENKDVIDSARLLAGIDAFSLFLQKDLGGAIDCDPVGDILKILGKDNPTVLQNATTLREQISDSESLYRYLKEWLNYIPNSLSKPVSSIDWSGMGEVLLWMGRLHVINELELTWLLKIDIKNTFEDILPLSDLTIGLFYFSPSLYASFINKNKQEITSLFQKSTKTIWLEEKDNNPTAHYIISDINLSPEQSCSLPLNELSVARATTLRKLFPDQEKYGTQGYGHQNILMELPSDESHKNIIKSALPVPQFVNVNSTWANYADYIFRPNDWPEYANNILSLREQIVEGLTILNRTLISYFKKMKAQPLIGTGKIEPEYWDNLAKIRWQLTKLPKLAVDPWGITSEGSLSRGEISGKNTANFTSMQDSSKSFRKSLGDYTFHLTNFFSHSNSILIFNSLIGRLSEEQHDELYQQADGLGIQINDHIIHLSCVNLNNALKCLKKFQRDFRLLFEELYSAQELNKLESKEEEKFSKCWALWYQFAHSPETHWKDAPDIRALARIAHLKRELISSIESSLRDASDGDAHLSVLNDCYVYQEQNALWIKVDIKDSDYMGYAFVNAVEALTDAIRPLAFRDLKFFVLEDLWDNFVLVPTNGNVAISNSAWVLLPASFVGEEPVLQEEKSLLYIPRPIASENLISLGLNSYDTPFTEVLNNLESETRSIFIIINHLQCFDTLAADANTVGVEILESYITHLCGPLAKHMNLALSFLEEIKKQIDKSEIHLLNLLDECELSLQPYEQPPDNLIKVHLGDCKVWAELLSEALHKLQTVKMNLLTFSEN
ncbi:hypothetical protein ACFOEE_16465 [Pseudoalteromonas fenneropenaei]|uniref:ATP-binding protein n=1 Tax=Pseudoalteromonas fenneropenaei TaxID=1737459 RepID=A0ABV7CNF4_9GAMM